MKRPSFQFYPADWRNNAKLRRCSEAARGAWMDVLCVLHDSDEYGVCRWPLADLARAAGVPLKLVKELATKDVLKGADKDAPPYIFTPRHAGKAGEPVTLVDGNGGACWYSSRFVRDEYVRLRRGQSTQFSSANQPPKAAPKATPDNAPKATPMAPPNPPIGERQGDGPTSSSTSERLKNPVPNGTDASASKSASPENEIEPKDALFQIAVPWLVSRGVKEANARSILGGAVKQLSADGAWMLASQCMTEKPMQPLEWLAAALNKQIAEKAGKGATKHGNFAAQDYHAGISADGRF